MNIILLIPLLMTFSFVVGAAGGIWYFRRYWRQLKVQEKFLDTRDKNLAVAERRLHDENERHVGILGIEGTVVVISHEVTVHQGRFPLLTQGGEMYHYLGPARRQHRLVLEEIVELAPTMEESPTGLEPTEEDLNDWDPSDYDDLDD